MPTLDEKTATYTHELSEKFDYLWQYVLRQKGRAFLPKDLTLWVGCPITEADHQESWRQFAHTYHQDEVVCVSCYLAEVDDPIIFGIFAHELGHIIAMNKYGNSSEANADRASRDFLGLTIHYTPYPKHLEFLRKDDLKKILG